MPSPKNMQLQFLYEYEEDELPRYLLPETVPEDEHEYKHEQDGYDDNEPEEPNPDLDRDFFYDEYEDSSEEEVEDIHKDNIRRRRKKGLTVFLSGFLTGAAVGLGIAFCTGGLGWFAIPCLAVLGGLYQVRKNYYAGHQAHNEDHKRWQDLSTGLLLGGSTGLACGLFLAPFTFGLSIPACLAIGAGAGALIGLIGAFANRWDNKELIKLNNCGQHGLLQSKINARENAYIGILAGLSIGLAFAVPTLGLSFLAAPLAGLIFYVVSIKTDRCLPPPANVTPTEISFSTSVGAALGGKIGLILGFVFAAPTFGLSIPLCGLMGAAVGGVIGHLMPRIKKGSSDNNCCSSNNALESSTKNYFNTFTSEHLPYEEETYEEWARNRPDNFSISRRGSGSHQNSSNRSTFAGPQDGHVNDHYTSRRRYS